jgi:preprotein translocase subunit SecB
VLAGINPIYIKNLNTLQPAQKPKNDSNDANKIKVDIKIRATIFKPNKKKTVVKIEKNNPTP